MRHRNPKISETFLALCHFRWSLPALAEFSRLEGQAKFVTLQRRLDVSRASLQRTLKSLIVLGLVKKNEGYGHPMRPEYLLTSTGGQATVSASRLMHTLKRQRLTNLGLRKWSMPVLGSLAIVPGQFNRLQAALTGITPRALSKALGDLEHAGWLGRALLESRPPRWDYRPLPKSKALVLAANELQRL
ncbi:MAG: winged helix-turn-helix transcriptional regulator [Myxococcota bacterium]